MIINILTKLELANNKTLRDIIFNRTNDYIPRNLQLLDVIASILKSRNHLEKIIEVIDEGVIAYDEGSISFSLMKLPKRYSASRYGKPK